jgi:hypothetical protein
MKLFEKNILEPPKRVCYNGFSFLGSTIKQEKNMVKQDIIAKAKNLGTVTATAVAVVFASSASALAQSNPAPTGEGGDVDLTSGIEGGSVAAQGTTQENTTLFGNGGIFETITNILLFLVGAISVIMLVVGGIRYVASGGDQQAVANAKNTILYAIVGIVVAFLAYAAVDFVSGQLNNTNTAAP